MKQTSIQAHESVKPDKPRQWQIILETMQRIGRPATSEQISVQCRLNYMQVVRRISELCEAGKLEDSGLKALNSSGRAATRWQLTYTQKELF